MNMLRSEKNVKTWEKHFQMHFYDQKHLYFNLNFQFYTPIDNMNFLGKKMVYNLTLLLNEK